MNVDDGWMTGETPRVFSSIQPSAWAATVAGFIGGPAVMRRCSHAGSARRNTSCGGVGGGNALTADRCEKSYPTKLRPLCAQAAAFFARTVGYVRAPEFFRRITR